MEVVVPWKVRIDLTEPHYAKVSKKSARPPYPLTTMLRSHLLQRWTSRSDPAMEEALIEVPPMPEDSQIPIELSVERIIFKRII